MSEELLINVNDVIRKIEYEIETMCDPPKDTDNKFEAFIKQVMPKLLHDVINYLRQQPTVDAVSVDNIIFHHILIDNEGVPEVKLQFGDRFMILRSDPVDVREVVHGRWIVEHEESIRCSECCFNRASIKIPMDYCPNCGARMDAKE